MERDILMRVLAEALYWRVRYDEVSPEVGMGPTLDKLLTEICDRVSVQLEASEKSWVIALLSRKN